MGFSNFRLNIILRVVILTASIFLFYLTFRTNYFFAPVAIIVLILFQIYALIKYVDKTNHELTTFLESLRFSEFTRTFQMDEMGSSFVGLGKAFNAVIRDFQQVRSEKEENYHYLQSIVHNIDISILLYTRDGNVEMINKAATKLFQISSLRNIHNLSVVSDELVQALLKIEPGENKLVKVQDENDILQLALYATEFKIKDKLVILTTIKNIQSVLERQETEAWQKLIRVLTHEIMNSITPIASLSATLEQLINNALNQEDEKISIDTMKEIREALQTINKRSTGLLHFVDSYRNLTRIPKPNFRIIKVKELFKNIEVLMEEEIDKYNIELTTSVVPESIEISADERLIEQVLLNLVKNALHACENKEKGVISLKAKYNKRERATIQVTDNGQGILSDVLDKIFIPFFTTKQRGSGIGLSLSKQIMRLHNGSISAHSEPGKETVFTLTF